MIEFETPRLQMRRLDISDAPIIYELANNFNVVKSTLGIPWPYTIEIAKSWIEKHKVKFENHESFAFAVVLKETGKIIGCIELMIAKNDNNAELGYTGLENDFGIKDMQQRRLPEQ